MACKFLKLIPLQIPKLGRLISTSCENSGAIMRKGNRPNDAGMAYKFLKLITLQIPELGRIIITSGKNAGAIRGEGN